MFLKRIFFLFFALIFVLFLHISLSYVFNIDKLFLPDFLLIIVLFLSIYFDNSEDLILIFLLGLLKDIFEIGVMGSNSFIYLILFVFIKFILDKLYKDNVLNLFIILFSSSLFYYILKYFLYLILGYSVYFNYFFIVKTIILVLVSPLIFKILIRQNILANTKNVTD